MTDGLITDGIQRNLILKEKDKYKDIKLQPLKGGRGQFGFRFLNQIKWAAAKFNFQYLLRIDDDYFLCSKRLLFELPLRPKQNLVWGFFHCKIGITWLDEAFDILQRYYSEVLGAERKLDVVSSTCGSTSHVVAKQYSKHNILPRYQVTSSASSVTCSSI